MARRITRAKPKQEAQPKRKVGRPTDYRPEYAARARRLYLLGLTDDEVCAAFDCNIVTLHAWRRNFPDFLKATTDGKVDADARVAERLYNRALGYEQPAVKIFMPAGFSEPVYASYTERFPPDTQAGSLWLRNRQRALWRDKIDHEHSGELTLREIIAASIEKPKS